MIGAGRAEAGSGTSGSGHPSCAGASRAGDGPRRAALVDPVASGYALSFAGRVRPDESPTLGRVTTDGTRRGQFLTLEGPEGAGKSTQAARVRDHLANRGRTVVLTREPGGTPLGEAIRDVLLATAPERHPAGPRVDALLFSAARAQLVATVIEPALERGEVVVCDRYADSTLAYQGDAAGLPLGELRELATFATGGLRPDLTHPARPSRGSRAGPQGRSGETRFEQAFDVDYHRRVRAGFLALAAAEPGRFTVVDAAQEPDAVTRDVLAAVDRLPVPGRTAERTAKAEPTHEPMTDHQQAAGTSPAAGTSDGHEPDEQLLAGLVDGRLDALDRLYEQYGAMAYSIAFRITGDATAAEDVVQDAFLGAWRNAARYVDARGSGPDLAPVDRPPPGDRCDPPAPADRRAARVARTGLPGALTLPDTWAEVELRLDREAVAGRAHAGSPTSSARRSSSPTSAG